MRERQQRCKFLQKQVSSLSFMAEQNEACWTVETKKKKSGEFRAGRSNWVWKHVYYVYWVSFSNAACFSCFTVLGRPKNALCWSPVLCRKTSTNRENSLAVRKEMFSSVSVRLVLSAWDGDWSRHCPLCQAPKPKTRWTRGSWPPKTPFPRPEQRHLPVLEVATQKFAETKSSKEWLKRSLVTPFAFYYPAPKADWLPFPLPQPALASQRILRPRPAPLLPVLPEWEPHGGAFKDKIPERSVKCSSFIEQVWRYNKRKTGPGY